VQPGQFETFSKREKRLNTQGQVDIYRYDEVPKPLRVQVIHIWGGALGPCPGKPDHMYDRPTAADQMWSFIHDQLARELGVFNLGESRDESCQQCRDFLLTADTNGALDIIDLSFSAIDRVARHLHYGDVERSGIVTRADDAIEELNHRFREHAVGYQFESGKLVRVDSLYMHAEAVKPALALLLTPGFEGANEEFTKAHDHYRHGRNKEALTDALKAFESTMKIICDRHNWQYPDRPQAKDLIKAIFDNGLISRSLESHFAGLRATLEAGIPTLRNRLSGHGQGGKAVDVPDYIASYGLHLTAANIVMLVEAHKNHPT
jgi:hypothetical protein